MDFKYTAADKKGRKISNVAQAENVSALVVRLKSEGLLPLKIQEVSKVSLQIKPSKMFKLQRNQVKSKEIVIFTRQLAATLSAGLLLTEALETIYDDLENLYFRKVIESITADIRSGIDFSTALTKYPKIFPVTYASIVRTGEATGTLDKTMTHLATYLENSERMREKVKTALRYPLFIFSFAGFVVMIIVVFLIPKFTKMFISAGAKLPLLTRIVVGISEFILHHLVLLVLFGILAWIGIWYLLQFPKAKFTFDAYKLKIPIVGKEIIHKDLVSRFCRTLGTLLAGGVGLSLSLEVASQAIGNLMMGDLVDKIRVRVISGATLSSELKKAKVFPPLVSKMVSVGERTGRIDEMLKRTSDYYDEEIDTSLQNLTSLLEPALIVFIGGIVLIVVLALYLPIFKLSAAMR